MKNIQKIKFITLASLFVVMLLLLPSGKASAFTYYAGENNEVRVIVNLDNGNLYGVNDPFSVTASLTSLYGMTPKVDMSMIAGGIFNPLFNLSTLNGSIFNTVSVTNATDTAHIGVNLVNFLTRVDSTEPVNPPNGTCVGTLTFQGQFRHGKVIYHGPNHGPLTIEVTEVGHVWPTPGSMTGEYPAFHPFTMPSGGDGTHSFWNGTDCNSYGCEIEGTGGFDHAYVSKVTPSTTSGPGAGKICVQSAPPIPPGCRYENTPVGECWQKPAGWACSAFTDENGHPAEDC